jgi:hypothetical protein
VRSWLRDPGIATFLSQVSESQLTIIAGGVPVKGTCWGFVFPLIRGPLQVKSARANLAVCVGGKFTQVSTCCAVLQPGRASWGSGAAGVAARASAGQRRACADARCGRSRRTAGRPARRWRREPAAWSTPRRGAGTAGTPSVLTRVFTVLPLISLMTSGPLHSVKGHVLCRESSTQCRRGMGRSARSRWGGQEVLNRGTDGQLHKRLPVPPFRLCGF